MKEVDDILKLIFFLNFLSLGSLFLTFISLIIYLIANNNSAGVVQIIQIFRFSSHVSAYNRQITFTNEVPLV